MSPPTRPIAGSSVTAWAEYAPCPAPGAGVALVAAQLAAMRTEYAAHSRWPGRGPHPGIPELLNAVARRGVPLAILSNRTHTAPVELVVDALGRWCFHRVWGARRGVAQAGYHKPSWPWPPSWVCPGGGALPGGYRYRHAHGPRRRHVRRRGPGAACPSPAGTGTAGRSPPVLPSRPHPALGLPCARPLACRDGVIVPCFATGRAVRPGTRPPRRGLSFLPRRPGPSKTHGNDDRISLLLRMQ